MNKEAKEVLEKILAKSLDALTESDKNFLRARVSYLNAAQLETYEEVLDGASSNAPVDVDEMSLKELKAHAKTLGVDITGLSKLADILEAVKAHQA